MKLTAKGIEHLDKPGSYADGKGLYLKILKAGGKNWVHRYQLNGKRHDMGLGSLDNISLKQARILVGDNHKMIDQRIDPINARKQNNLVKTLTFDKCAEEVIASKKSGWKNPKSSAQWKSSLMTYASHTIGNLAVDQITTEHVIQILKPIWATKNETASRVRSRIEIILDWAKVMGYRTGENPALWRGHLEHLLAKPSKVQKVKHHKALPYNDLSKFMVELMPKTSISAKALQFTILTACRTSEVLGASWDEIDMDQRTWTIPLERMKKGDKPHTVPLSNQAIELLNSLSSKEGWLFPSVHYGKHLSNMSMLILLQRVMGYPDLTVHGFRSTFRDWTAEQTNTPNHVAEMALSHSIASDVEKSYRRGDLLKKRAVLMQHWGNYCCNGSSVVPFKKVASRV